MLHECLRSLKLFWIIFKAIRTAIATTAMMLAAAFFFVPATIDERRVLGADTAIRDTLLGHRMATLLVKADSDWLYTSIAESSLEHDISPWQVRFMVERLADGTVRFDENGGVTGTIAGIPPQTASTSRNFVRNFVPAAPSDGLLTPRTPTAKFVSARDN